MNDLDLLYRPAHLLAEDIRLKRLSPVDLMQACLNRIDSVNERLNCFCLLFHDEAMAMAKKAEQAIMSNAEVGALHGIPFAVKDVTPMAGKRLTRGSKVYEHHVADRDALIVQRLMRAGAIPIGKTTTPEFAYSSFTDSPLWGRTANPWDLERTPGGSSGGSAAAVASGCTPLAEGTDMGGSVRIPASFCGLVGLKPSLGRIPMDILPTVFDNISHFGPLTRNVTDANLFMNAVSGPYERDITSLPDKLTFPLPADADVGGVRLALSVDLGYYAVDVEVEKTIRHAADLLEQQGAVVTEVDLKWRHEFNKIWYQAWGVYLDVCFAKDFDSWRDEMDPLVVKLIEQSRTISAAKYKHFEVLRTEQWHELCRVFDQHDALIVPTMAHPAVPHSHSDELYKGFNDAGKFKGLDMTCIFNNVAQCPALSVPAGFSTRGLPIGLQIVGHRFADLLAMRVGAALEQALPAHEQRPDI